MEPKSSHSKTTGALALFTAILLWGAHPVSAQTPTNVVVNILAEGNNPNVSWGLPASVQMSFSKPALTYDQWFQVYGFQETGGPIFSSEVPADAMFYHPDRVSGFPIPSTCSCPCPYLADQVSIDTSFLAISQDTNGNTEVWISACAMGQCVNPDIGLYKWYWQLRYYSGDSSQNVPALLELGVIPTIGDYANIETFTDFSITGVPIPGATVTGTISSISGNPVGDATVQIGSASAVSTANGTYTIQGLKPGTYTVTVSEAGYDSLTTTLDIVDDSPITQNFTLTPQGPVVVSVITQYSPNQEALYFLNGVFFPVTFMATVDWGKNTPGTVKFIAPLTGIYAVATSGNTASQEIDVGSEIGTSEKLQVQAVSAEGITSPGKVANCIAMDIPLAMPFQLSTAGTSSGSIFSYVSTLGANFQFMNDFLPPGYAVDPNIPLLGEGNKPGAENLFGLTWGPTLQATIKGNVAEVKLKLGGGAFITQLTSNDFPNLKLGPVTLTLEPKITCKGTYTLASGQWNWKGTVGLGGMASIKPPPWPFTYPGPPPIPMFIKVVIAASADANLNVINLSPANYQPLGGSASFTPSVTGTLAAGFNDVVSAGAWISGDVKLSFQYPLAAEGSHLASATITIKGGFSAYVFGLTYNAQLVQWQWNFPSGSKPEIQIWRTPTMPLSPRPYPRDYLKRSAYAVFKGALNAGPQQSPHPLDASNNPENPLTYPLQTNVFPFSDPRLSASGTNCYAVWLYDNTNRTANNRTMLVFSTFNGTNWSNPAPVADDGTADFHPQLRTFADGSAIAVWENEAVDLPANADLNAVVTNLEIASAFYSPAAGGWQPMQRLTSNNYLDRTPKISGPSETNLMLVWVANTNNDLEGNVTNANQLWSSLWNGSGWSEPRMFASVPYPLLKDDLIYDGTNAHLVMSLDADNALTNVNAHQLFEVVYQNNEWGSLAQLTTNQVANENPKMAIDPNGHVILVWLEGDSLSYVVDFNFTSQQTAGTNGYSSNLGDFALANSPGGQLAVVWAEPSSQYPSDLYTMIYDPTFQVWGAAKQLTADPQTEMGTAATFYNTNQLIALYDRLDIAIGDTNENDNLITNADLYALQYQLTNNLALDTNSLSASPANPTPGGNATLFVTAENLGDGGVSNVLVAFYQGNPAEGGTVIAQTNLSFLLAPGASNVVSVPWTVPAVASPITVYAVIDPHQQYPQSNVQDEQASAVFLEPDLSIASLTWAAMPSNSFTITATVVNQGSVSNQPAAINFYLNSQNGLSLFSTNIGSLAPGQSMAVGFLWNSSTVSNLAAGVNLVAVIDSGTNADFNPIDETLETTIEPAITQGTVRLGPVSLLPSGVVQVTVAGVVGQGYSIQVSTNLVSWSSLTNLKLTNATGQFLDSSTTNWPTRFYRAVQP